MLCSWKIRQCLAHGLGIFLLLVWFWIGFLQGKGECVLGIFGGIFFFAVALFLVLFLVLFFSKEVISFINPVYFGFVAFPQSCPFQINELSVFTEYLYL